jgi:hypothetical protein
MNTTLNDGERIIIEHKDTTNWMFKKMGIPSEYATIGARRPTKSDSINYGNIVLTNLRIIFESHKGQPNESHWHQDIVSTMGTPSGISVGIGEFIIFKESGPSVWFLMHCGEKFSNYLMQKVYTPEMLAKKELNLAISKEEHLDYVGAIEIYEKLNMHNEAARIRRKMYDEKKVDQTVVHGDYVDDRDTIVKDSVINRSNIGSGGKSKSEELREAKALLDDGIIDDDEFKQMKKEILGK